MADLEQQLLALAAEVEWPPAPRLELPVEVRRRGWRPLVVLAAVIVAVAVAFAVPGARSAILRAFHLEGATVERVAVLPPAQERSLGAGLGARVTPAEAGRALGRQFVLPASAGVPVLHLSDGTVSTVLSGRDPVLLSELRNDVGPYIVKKLAGGATQVETVDVSGAEGLWVAGGRHVYMAPGAPPRLAGNVLLWTAGHLLYRLEGRNLTKEHALELARELTGT